MNPSDKIQLVAKAISSWEEKAREFRAGDWQAFLFQAGADPWEAVWEVVDEIGDIVLPSQLTWWLETDRGALYDLCASVFELWVRLAVAELDSPVEPAN